MLDLHAAYFLWACSEHIVLAQAGFFAVITKKIDSMKSDQNIPGCEMASLTPGIYPENFVPACGSTRPRDITLG